MGACLDGILLCIRSAREETHSCGVFSAWAPRASGHDGPSSMVFIFGFCIYTHTPGLEAEQHYCIHRTCISPRFIQSVCRQSLRPRLTIQKKNWP